MARVEVTPPQFELVHYEASVIAGIAEELAPRIGLPDDLPIAIEIDEELPLPLIGSTVDVADGRAELWFSGASFEDGRHRTRFHDEIARTELAVALYRTLDRLGPAFTDAPVDEDLSDAQRAAWEAWAEGRAARLGQSGRRPRRQYLFRLYNGFTDIADRVFDQLWTGDDFTWSQLDAMCAECRTTDRPKPQRKAAIRRETLRASK